MLDFSGNELDDRECELIYEFNVPQCNDEIFAVLSKFKSSLTIIGKQESISTWISQILSPFAFIIRFSPSNEFREKLVRIANCVVAHDLVKDKYILVKSRSMMFVDSTDELKDKFNMKVFAFKNAVQNGDKEVKLSISKLSYEIKTARCLDDVVKIAQQAVVQKFQ